MITIDEILMGRDKEYPLTPEQQANLMILLTQINIVRKAYGRPMKVSSGYRPGKYNSAAGGAKNSSHLSCEAVDIADSDRRFMQWCVVNLSVLEKAGLYMEDPEHTPSWVHLQTRKPKSGNRIFKP